MFQHDVPNILPVSIFPTREVIRFPMFQFNVEIWSVNSVRKSSLEISLSS